MTKGYKQTPEHIEKRQRFGAKHGGWKGQGASVKAGRTRAERLYPDVSSCGQCGGSGLHIDRHHRDGNTLNNSPENVFMVCRKCHMEIDGRLRALVDRTKNARTWKTGGSDFTADDITAMRTMHDHGMGQRAIGEKFGISQTAVSKWLRGIWRRS